MHMMAYLTMLLITILTVAIGTTSLYCSDVQSPASGSLNTDLSQVTTLQYCVIDNCTIMRIDSGQQLEIMYTTQSLLIVTPIGRQTLAAISKIDNEQSCLEHHNGSQAGLFVGKLTLSLLVMMMSGYILLVHFLFKELHSVFGKLLIFYNLSFVCTVCSVIALLFINSQTICHAIMIAFMITHVSTEVFAANILTHLAYTMYRCYNLKSRISKKRSKYLLKCYMLYASITLVLVLFITIAYDLRTGNGKYTILPNGHCNFIDQYSYKMLFIIDIPNFVNKLVQITMFIIYLVYFNKFNAIIRDAKVSNMQYHKGLFKIAITMGATVGLSSFIWILSAFYPGYTEVIAASGSILLFIQQCVIATSFLYTRKIYDLCKMKFSRDSSQA